MRVADSIIKPLRPIEGTRWEYVGELSQQISSGFPVEIWEHPDGFNVLSGVETVVDQFGTGSAEPHYHISMTRTGMRRVPMADAVAILRQFQADGFEEDNHVEHGKARNFWRPIAEHLIGQECPCKKVEPRIIEDRGDFVIRPA